MQFLVMDKTGDTRTTFDMSSAEGVRLAEERFRELTGKGFRAAKLTDDGKPGELMRSFDKTAEKVLFIPALQGG